MDIDLVKLEKDRTNFNMKNNFKSWMVSSISGNLNTLADRSQIQDTGFKSLVSVWAKTTSKTLKFKVEQLHKLIDYPIFKITTKFAKLFIF